MKRAVVLLSGGIDSSTTLAIAIAEDYETYALSFDYGGRHLFRSDAAARNRMRAQKIFSFSRLRLPGWCSNRFRHSKARLRVSFVRRVTLHADRRLAIRLSLPKGQSRVRVALYSGAPKTPHLNPL